MEVGPNRAFTVELLLLASLCLPADAQERTTLTLRSQPGVEVLWQGVRIGTIEEDGQLLIRNVPPGEFEIRLSKLGYQYRAESVRIEGFQPVTQAFPLEALAPQTSPDEASRVEADRVQVAVPPQPVPIEPRGPDLEQDVASLPAAEPDSEIAVAAEPTASVTIEAARNVQPTQRDSVARSDSSSSSTLTLVLLVLAVLAALVWVMRYRLPLRRPTIEPRPTAEPRPPTWDPPPPESDDISQPQDLLGEIRRRERDRDHESEGRPRVIEAEFVELPDPEGRTS